MLISFFFPPPILYFLPSLLVIMNLRFFLISIGSLIRCYQSMWCWIRLMPCFERPTRLCHQYTVVSHSTSSGNSSTTSYPTSQPLTSINYSNVITGYQPQLVYSGTCDISRLNSEATCLKQPLVQVPIHTF